MNLIEYDIVKNFTYQEYCDYLQKKYGVGLCAYMTQAGSKKPKVSRTKEGLMVHHKYEDRAILLSKPEYALQYPYEWQSAENLVYCDYLEHLLLHILICEYPSVEKNIFEEVGVGGIIRFLVPELNDFYSGWQTKEQWRLNCHNLIRDDMMVYLQLLKRFKQVCKQYPFITVESLCTCFNEQYGTWEKRNNQKLFDAIRAL